MATTLKQRRIAEARAQDTGRNIITTYYETPAKRHSMKVIRSMHASTAVPNVIKHMQSNDYDARVAEVWDDSKSELLIVVVLPLVGKAEITYYYDPITGEKLRPQPRELRQISETAFADRMAKIVDQLSADISSGASIATIDKAMVKMAHLREQVKPKE